MLCPTRYVALHAGVVHIVAADGVAAAQAFEAGQLLLRLTQRGFGASHFGLRQAQGGARLGVVQLEQHVTFFHVLAVSKVDSGDVAFRTRAQFNGVNRFNATRDLTFGGVGGLLHGGDTHGNDYGECGRQGSGEEYEQEREFHGSTSVFSPHPNPLPKGERELEHPLPFGERAG